MSGLHDDSFDTIRRYPSPDRTTPLVPPPLSTTSYRYPALGGGASDRKSNKAASAAAASAAFEPSGQVGVRGRNVNRRSDDNDAELDFVRESSPDSWMRQLDQFLREKQGAPAYEKLGEHNERRSTKNRSGGPSLLATARERSRSPYHHDPATGRRTLSPSSQRGGGGPPPPPPFALGTSPRHFGMARYHQIAQNSSPTRGMSRAFMERPDGSPADPREGFSGNTGGGGGDASSHTSSQHHLRALHQTNAEWVANARQREITARQATKWHRPTAAFRTATPPARNWSHLRPTGRPNNNAVKPEPVAMTHAGERVPLAKTRLPYGAREAAQASRAHLQAVRRQRAQEIRNLLNPSNLENAGVWTDRMSPQRNRAHSGPRYSEAARWFTGPSARIGLPRSEHREMSPGPGAYDVPSCFARA